MATGLARIRREAEVPGNFPPEVQAAADAAVARQPGPEHVDRTDRRFVTIDPATSVDLDQALFIEPPGGGDADIVLHYAIADVGWFVRPGDALDIEAFRRGVTIYLPDGRSTLYPTSLSEGAASLLPDVDRPAVVFTVRVDAEGEVRLDGVERALIRNHAKLAYDSVRPGDLPEGFDELYRRVGEAERRRGASRVEFPEQVIERDEAGRYTLRFRPRLESEEQNASMSLATNLAVADLLHAAHTGLFRVMPDVDDRGIRRLRNTARAFGIEWPAATPLAEFERSLDRTDRRHLAFLLAVRRAAGGASYEPYAPDHRPWHSAMAATYAQATAPLRRLQDRYVIEAALAVANSEPVPDEIASAFDRLPKAMAHAEQKANRVERQALDLAEAVALIGREGETFTATVIDESERGVEVQLTDPAVLARISAHRVDPGDTVHITLRSVDLETAETKFERVS